MDPIFSNKEYREWWEQTLRWWAIHSLQFRRTIQETRKTLQSGQDMEHIGDLKIILKMAHKSLENFEQGFEAVSDIFNIAARELEGHGEADAESE